jgi:Tfp pilus assembly PilM family ATPase
LSRKISIRPEDEADSTVSAPYRLYIPFPLAESMPDFEILAAPAESERKKTKLSVRNQTYFGYFPAGKSVL